METRKEYRNGAIGALMDEYERATSEMVRVIQSISDNEFDQTVDKETLDENCRSIQTIAGHVVAAGYSYADYIREQFEIPITQSKVELFSHSEFITKLNQMLAYTEQTLQDKWLMSDESISSVVI